MHQDANSVSEATEALKFGASFIKVFPGSTMGGVKEIKTISPPYHLCRFLFQEEPI